MSFDVATNAPSKSPRPKPSLHLELDDLKEAGTLSVGQSISITATGKLTSMSEEEYGETKRIHTNLTLRLTSITRTKTEAP